LVDCDGSNTRPTILTLLENCLTSKIFAIIQTRQIKALLFGTARRETTSALINVNFTVNTSPSVVPFP
jgi:hypothetical protein